jgi:SNF2 family DNA or RNA helicase
MAKARRVLDLVRAIPEPVILFVNYRATLEALRQMFATRGVDHVVFTGGMTNEQKRQAVEAFRKGRRVFLSTGTGGEGHNLQFCHTLINYDLPWNPIEIEQRIGRLHRIGQRHPVQVYNFCTAGSIEERILDVLDRKINMFELVVGEIDMILGRLQGEKEFAEMVFDLWVTHGDEASREKAFEALAARLKRARSAYEKTKALDEKLFQDDFGT